MYHAELLREKNQFKEENEHQIQVLAEVALNQSHLVRTSLASILGLIDILDADLETSVVKKLLKC